MTSDPAAPSPDPADETPDALDSPAAADGAARPGRSRLPLLLAGAGIAVAAVVAIILVLTLPAGLGASAGDPSATPGGTTTPAAPHVPPSATPTPVEQPPAGEPVPIESPAPVVEGLTASITGIEAVDGVARGPGEVSGPSIRFTVTIANTTGSAVDLTGTVVTVDYGSDRTPAGQLYEPGAVPLPTSVPAGGSASGVFVFAIPPESRGLVHITVDYAVDVAPLVFAGAVP